MVGLDRTRWLLVFLALPALRFQKKALGDMKERNTRFDASEEILDKCFWYNLNIRSSNGGMARRLGRTVVNISVSVGNGRRFWRFSMFLGCYIGCSRIGAVFRTAHGLE